MRVLLTTLLTAGVALATPTLASAQTPATADVRCLLTMAALASNEEARTQAMAGVYYFAARVVDRNPAFNFGTDLRAEADKLTRSQLQAEVTRCTAILQTVARNLQAAQASMQGFTPRP